MVGNGSNDLPKKGLHEMTSKLASDGHLASRGHKQKQAARGWVLLSHTGSCIALRVLYLHGTTCQARRRTQRQSCLQTTRYPVGVVLICLVR